MQKIDVVIKMLIDGSFVTWNVNNMKGIVRMTAHPTRHFVVRRQ